MAFSIDRRRPRTLPKYRMIALQASQPAAVSAARSNANSNTLDGLSKVAVPTFIIQGRYDRARTPEHGSVMRTTHRGQSTVRN
jgi:pimeloyl-ACP methyl ester carboxylesterase